MIDPVIIPLAALAIPIVVVPTAMGFKHAARLRAYDHAERMRALELGRLDPGGESWPVPAKVGVAIGAGVPIVAIGAGLISTAFAWSGPALEAAWTACGFIGVAGVLGGTFLAARLRPAESHQTGAAKPSYDPDAFEFAGRS